MSGKSGFYEKSVYADGVMESSLAPLIDKVMRDNSGVYVKSHPKGREDKPHIEVHVSIMVDAAENAEEKLQRAVVQLSGLVEEVGGRIIVVE
jgi:molybdopterin-biosynthesis enzyme MoeA-like protein